MDFPLEPAAGPSPSADVLLRFARRAMATSFELLLPFSTPFAHELAAACLDEIDRQEDLLTVYRDTSPICRLNATAWRHPVRVDPEIFELLRFCQELHARTEGAFDIAIGALIKAWGFYRRAGRLPSEPERELALRCSGMQHVRLDAVRGTVGLARSGVEFNLGSVGKGYALDRAAEVLQGTSFLLHGGHSSVLAQGHETSGAHGWTVGLLDPERRGFRRGVFRLHQRGMATSAATYQHFVHDGRTLGHVLDPRTAWPAEQCAAVTVTAPTAAEADALATAFFVLGLEKARAYCESHPNIGAVLLTQREPTRLHILGQARAEFSPA